MAPCPSCGSSNPQENRVCGQCGTPLAGTSGGASKNPALGRTMLGVPARPIEVPPGTPHPGVTSAQGDASAQLSGQRSAQGTAPAQRSALAGTMIGMPSPFAAPAPDVTQAPRALASAELKAPTGRDLGRTLLGVARPGIAPAQSAAPSPPPLEPSAKTATDEATDPGRTAKYAPPVAHSHASDTGPSLPAPAPRRQYAPVVPAPRPQRPEPGSASTRPTKAKRPKPASPSSRFRGRSALLLGAGLLFAATFGGLLALVIPKAPKLTVAGFEVTSTGQDQIRLACPGCSAGAQLTLDGRTFPVEEGEAKVLSPAPLKVGNNELEVLVVAADGNQESVTISVPVAFRVRSDLSGAANFPPFAQVLVTVPADAQVTINGNPTPVEAGVAILRVSLADEARGEALAIKDLSHDYPVTVVGPELNKKTVARIQSPIAPLALELPAPLHVLSGGQITVRGRTTPKAPVTVRRGAEVLGQATADDAGTFQLLVTTHEAGTWAITSAPVGYVARTAEVALAQKGSSATPVGYDSLSAATGPVQIAGVVVESRTSGGSTHVILEVSQACSSPPCLLSVVHAEAKQLRPGNVISAIGVVAPGPPLTLRASELR